VAPHEIPAGDEVTVPLPVPLLPAVTVYWITSKLAVTVFAALMVTEQLPKPAHAPDQPVKVEVASVAAVRFTTGAGGEVPAQVLPQLMPVGDDVTVPPPVPPLATVRPNWIRSKFAVTDLAASAATVQVPAPAHDPLQPMNVEVPSETAVSVTEVPALKVYEQVPPQLIPAGDEVTVPPPVPVLAMLMPFWTTSKLAVADFAASTVTVQVAVPLHAPDQPVKIDVPSAAGVRVTREPVVKLAEQVAPQAIPMGEDVMVPPPAPVLPAVRAYWTRSKLAVTDFAASTVTTQVPVPLHTPDSR